MREADSSGTERENGCILPQWNVREGSTGFSSLLILLFYSFVSNTFQWRLHYSSLNTAARRFWTVLITSLPLYNPSPFFAVHQFSSESSTNTSSQQQSNLSLLPLLLSIVICHYTHTRLNNSHNLHTPSASRTKFRGHT
jgi:hypothetical protein